ncbi:glycine-rich domain-containing protein [Mycolicibacterium insubricum]
MTAAGNVGIKYWCRYLDRILLGAGGAGGGGGAGFQDGKGGDAGTWATGSQERGVDLLEHRLRQRHPRRRWQPRRWVHHHRH